MMNLFRRKTKYLHQDRIALRIADRYGLVNEYKEARRHRLSPIEALDDWDLLDDEALAMLNNDASV